MRVRRGENTSWADSVSWETGDVETRATVTKLRPFTVYSFRVVAIYSGGEESESEESFYMITLREAPSGSPTITMAHNISSNALYMVSEQSQLRYERHPSVHKLFLNMWGARNYSRQ